MRKIIPALTLLFTLTAFLPYEQNAIKGAASTLFYYDNCTRSDVSQYALTGAKMYRSEYPAQVQAEYDAITNLMKKSGFNTPQIWCATIAKTIREISPSSSYDQSVIRVAASILFYRDKCDWKLSDEVVAAAKIYHDGYPEEVETEYRSIYKEMGDSALDRLWDIRSWCKTMKNRTQAKK